MTLSASLSRIGCWSCAWVPVIVTRNKDAIANRVIIPVSFIWCSPFEAQRRRTKMCKSFSSADASLLLVGGSADSALCDPCSTPFQFVDTVTWDRLQYHEEILT